MPDKRLRRRYFYMLGVNGVELDKIIEALRDLYASEGQEPPEKIRYLLQRLENAQPVAVI
jgi:hypothetical protein